VRVQRRRKPSRQQIGEGERNAELFHDRPRH
jgi:hypothetical protein